MAPAEWLSTPLAQRWALALVHFAWQGFVVAGLLGLLLKFWGERRASWRYAACLGAMAATVACPLVTFLLVDARPQPQELAMQLRERLNPPPTVESTAPAENNAGTSDAEDTPILPGRPDVLAPEGPSSASLTATLLQLAERAQPWLLLLWVAGVLILSGRLLLGAAGVRRLKAAYRTHLRGTGAMRPSPRPAAGHGSHPGRPRVRQSP